MVITMNEEANKEVIEKIKSKLDILRGYLVLDGGDCEFVKYQDKIVYIRLLGHCAQCLAQDETINNGIYAELKEEIPEIEGEINVTV